MTNEDVVDSECPRLGCISADTPEWFKHFIKTQFKPLYLLVDSMDDTMSEMKEMMGEMNDTMSEKMDTLSEKMDEMDNTVSEKMDEMDNTRKKNTGYTLLDIRSDINGIANDIDDLAGMIAGVRKKQRRTDRE